MAATRFVDRLSTRLSPRISRRGFFARSAVVGSALAAAPTEYVLKPGTAYAAICNCYGSNCDCGATCCDGYTEFCCTLYGNNQCPPGTMLGGWWKADGTGLCGGPRYYMDCNANCGGCGCGGNGICAGTCTGTPCGCAGGNCGNRKSGCTHFRYGQCHQGTACLGPIVCRVVTCIPPWQIDGTCTTLTLVDQNTAYHDRPCLHRTIGSLDSAVDVGGAIRVMGWALDFDTSASIDVHVYVDGAIAAAVTADKTRNDIAAAYPGEGSAHGYDVIVGATAGTHKVDVYAINTGPASDTGNPLLGTASVGVNSPFGSLDTVAGGLNAVRAVGWAIDPDGPAAIDVHAYLDGVFAGVFTANVARPDIASLFPSLGPNHGFDFTIPATGGSHTLAVYGINVGPGKNSTLGSRVVNVNPNPIGNLEAIVPTLGGTMQVIGWALDPDTTGPVDIHVYVDGAKVGTGTANQSRPDVAQAFPSQGPNHGFTIAVPVTTGTHTVDVYAINLGAGDANPLLGRRTVHIGDPPFGNVESVSALPMQVRAVGWALDPDTATPIDVHVYVDGVKQGSGTAQLPRPDIAGAFPGYGANHGFDITVPVSSGGAHIVNVYAINVGTGASNPLIGTKGATTGGNPFGSLDGATASTGSVHLTGWAIDPDTAAAVDVHVYVDGVMKTVITANVNRPDVGSAYPGVGAAHGFDQTIALPAGDHRIDVYAINLGLGTANPLIGTRNLTVP